MHTNYTYIILKKIDDALKEKNLEEQEWGSPVGGDQFTSDDSDEEDVPNVSDDKPYNTYRTIPSENSKIREQPEDKTTKTPEYEEVPQEVPAEDIDTQDPTMTQDPGMMDPSMTDPSMTGMGMGSPYYEPPKDPVELGRTYELKKIYARLVSIESYLSTSSDPEILMLRKYVSQAIEMFKTLSSNVDSYKDRVDEVIIIFYKFLKAVYTMLDKYYSQKKIEDKKYGKNLDVSKIDFKDNNRLRI